MSFFSLDCSFTISSQLSALGTESLTGRFGILGFEIGGHTGISGPSCFIFFRFYSLRFSLSF